jgi:hypothetical protein
VAISPGNPAPAMGLGAKMPYMAARAASTFALFFLLH